MTDHEMLQAILEKLEAIEERLGAVEENTAVTRGAVNSLVEWADQVAVISQVHFPVRKAK